MDGSDVERSALFKEAERRAARYAPPPKMDPEPAGCGVAAVAIMALVLGSILAGAEIGFGPIGAVGAIFWTLTYLGVSAREKRHRSAREAELKKLQTGH